MADLRKLQFIGKQYCLNIPKGFVKTSGWQRGDYFAIEAKGQDTLEIKRIVEQPIGTDPRQRANLLTKFFGKFRVHGA